MEEEFDIRPYIEVLRSKWYWIVGGAIIAGLVAFAVSSFLTPSYEATALVVVTQPTEIVEFDSRIRSVDDTEPITVFPEIALSDELILTLLPQINSIAPEIQSVEDVRRLLEANSAADPNLLRLTATYKDPEKTSEIANLWADLFVIQANQVYGNSDGKQLAFYEQQAGEAADKLNAAEQTLIEFEARNRTAILDNQLESLKQIQSDYLDEQRQIILLTQDVQALRDQLAQQPDDVDITFADQLVSLSLQAKAYGVEGMPIQFQWDSTDGLVASGRPAQLAFLDDLGETLTIRATQAAEALAELEPQILALQTEKQIGDTESNQVQRNYTLAEETYTALISRVEAERITSQDVNNRVKLISETTPPDKPISPKKLTNTVLAMVVGLMIGIGIVFLIVWYEDLYKPQSEHQSQSQNEHGAKNGSSVKTDRYPEHSEKLS